MARSNLENTAWVLGRSMAADSYSSVIDLRDTGQANGIVQVSWSGFDAPNGSFELQVTHVEARGWAKLCDPIAVTKPADCEVFLVNFPGLVLMRLAFFKGAGTAGSFDASYFLKGY